MLIFFFEMQTVSEFFVLLFPGSSLYIILFKIFLVMVEQN